MDTFQRSAQLTVQQLCQVGELSDVANVCRQHNVSVSVEIAESKRLLAYRGWPARVGVVAGPIRVRGLRWKTALRMVQRGVASKSL